VVIPIGISAFLRNADRPNLQFPLAHPVIRGGLFVAPDWFCQMHDSPNLNHMSVFGSNFVNVLMMTSRLFRRFTAVFSMFLATTG